MSTYNIAPNTGNNLHLSKALHVLAFLLLAIPFLVPAGSYAQTSTIRGFVTSGVNGDPLQGAGVVLRQAGEYVAGAATGGEGLYVIAEVPSGRYTLLASFIGFATYRDTLMLDSGEIYTLNIALSPAPQMLDEVVVETGNTGAAAVQAGKINIRPADIQRIPSIGATPDLVDYLTSLPGVVMAGDQGGQLYVRGGKATQNLILIDGIPVFRPFHIVGASSMFPADLIESVELYAGGFGARYGGRLSSVIDVAMRNGNMKQFAAAASVDPLLAAIQIEGPFVEDRIALLVSIRQSLIRQSAPLFVGRPLPFTFSDQLAKADILLNPTNRLSITVAHSSDRGAIGAGDAADDTVTTGDAIRWENLAAGIRYLYLPGEFPVLAEAIFSGSFFENAINDIGFSERTAGVRTFRANANLTYFLRRAEVQGGFFLRTARLAYDMDGLFQNIRSSRVHYQTSGAAFLQAAIPFGAAEFNPGVRISTFPSSGSAFIAPRVRLAWDLGLAQVNAALGMYHQEIAGLQDERDAGDVFTAWVPQVRGQETATAMHAIVGARGNPRAWLSVSAEAYYKDLSHLNIPEWNAFPQHTTRLQKASGRVYGMDVRLEVDRSWFYGYIGYGYANTLYKAEQTYIPELTGTERFPPPHDRRHNVDVVTSATWSSVTAGARWQFGSGRPFTRVLGYDDWIMMQGLVDVVDFGGLYRVIYGPRYRDRLPTFHRLDVSLAWTFSFSENTSATIKASVINAYNRRNLFYFDLFEFRRVDQLPVFPSLSMKVDFR